MIVIPFRIAITCIYAYTVRCRVLYVYYIPFHWTKLAGTTGPETDLCNLSCLSTGFLFIDMSDIGLGDMC